MKGKSVVEVLIVFALTTLLSWWLNAEFMRLQLDSEVQRWLGGAVFIAISLVVIGLTRKPWAEYGLTRRDWRLHLDVGMLAYLASFITLGTLFALILLNVDYNSWAGAVPLAVASMAATTVLLAVLNRQDTKDPSGQVRRSKARTNLIVLGGLMLLPIGLSILMGRFSWAIVSTVAWQFIVSGFGEELRFRSYYQSRVNQEFGRPWQVLGVRFGPGLITASALFGLVHAFNTFNPLAGMYEPAWPWAFWTFFGGLFFGLIRERTNTLVAPAIAHGGPDAVGEALGMLFGRM